jgi:hypothetical protein
MTAPATSNFGQGMLYQKSQGILFASRLGASRILRAPNERRHNYFHNSLVYIGTECAYRIITITYWLPIDICID